MFRSRAVRALMTGLIAAALTTSAAVATQTVARADTAPPSGTPATVTADPLPTVQINGVVWAQVVVGDTVYATGSFTSARPAGAPAGTNETPRGNLLAYSLSTGKLVTGFDHTLNGQGKAIAASPDGSRLYVGGEFTTVDGVKRNRLAAFDLPSGALSSTFAPNLNASVQSLATAGDTVFAGGVFSTANGVARIRLASFGVQGTLLPWAPQASATVTALVVTPDRSKVVVGGGFNSVNGAAAYGIAGVDATTGASVPWYTNQYVKAYAGTNSGITSLTTDGTNIYGSAFTFASSATANIEGTFAIRPTDGSIVWVNDCQGDTYGTAPVGKVLYTVSHVHNCSMIGAFPDRYARDPYHHATAFTTYPTTTNTGPDMYGWNYSGVPAGSVLNWYPDFTNGTYTGQDQAGWSVVGTSDYVAVAGEFPTVNGVAQQGIVRFATKATVTPKVAPEYSGMAAPSLSLSGSTATARWTTTWDRDNANLSYAVLRDNIAVCTKPSVSSLLWVPTSQTCTASAAPGGTHTWRVRATDPDGNVKLGPTVTASY